MIALYCHRCGTTVERRIRVKMASCISCKAALSAAHHRRNRDRMLNQTRAYFKKHREAIRLAKKQGLSIPVARARLAAEGVSA